ncbi:hypothetical protein ACUTJJ_23910 [Agrobacterium sp. DKPNP3]
MQPDHGIGIDLQDAREKTATGGLTNMLTSSLSVWRIGWGTNTDPASNP